MAVRAKYQTTSEKRLLGGDFKVGEEGRLESCANAAKGPERLNNK